MAGTGPSRRSRKRAPPAGRRTAEVALLDVNLGDQLVTLVAEALRSRGVPFAVASAYDKPELVGGAVLAGVPNVGKPTSEWSLLEVLAKLSPP